MAAGVSRPWSTTGERHPRKDKECSPGCGPEPSTPTRPRRPWPGRCQALCCFSTPFPGPSAHLLALSTPAILNGSLCAPQELARKSPDRNAGQRYLLWIQAPLGAVPILWKAGLFCAASLFRIWERAGAWVNGRMFCTPAQWAHHQGQGDGSALVTSRSSLSHSFSLLLCPQR